MKANEEEGDPLVHLENLQERIRAIENELNINTSVWKSLSYNESCEENCNAEDESMKISEDVHSFLFTSNIFSLPFMFGILAVIVFQVLVLALIISHVFELGVENPLQIPGNVEIQVRVSQIIALFISVFIQDDSREGMEQLLRGFPSMYKGNDNLRETMTPLKWYFGNTIRCLSGMLIIVTSFMLLVTVDTVLDVVLNFLGVQFVGSLDDLAFMLCKTGYFGKILQRKSNDIATVEFKNEKKVDIWLQRFGYGYLAHYVHSILISILLLIAMVIFYGIASKQSKGFWFDKDLLIEIGDETFPYIGLFSGCYKRMSKELIHGRAVYKQHGVKEGGVFAFCNRIDDKPGWTLNLWSFNDNPCENFIIKSIETKTFDLADLGQEQWYTNENIPLDLISISEVGNDAMKTCAINMLDLATGSCPEIEAVGAWPQFFTTSTFEKLEHVDELKKKLEESLSKDYPSMTQIHPIFINKDAAAFLSPKEIQLILFTGRRWVLVFAHNIKAFKGNCSDDTISNSEYAKDTIAKSEACVKTIKEYFKNGDTFDLIAQTDNKTKWVLSVSEGVQLSSDPGSPIALRWHTPDSSKKDEVIGFAKPKLTPDDIVLKCSLCETDDQCQFGGSCIIDPANKDSKICNCTNSGAMGSHCDIIPSSNGICNPTFNTENYDWDGGDCCFGSCQGQECGIDGLKSYFGFKLESPVFGYEDCKDPSMAELKFEVKGFLKRNGDIADMTIPLTIFCGSDTVFQSLPFDWKMSEWNTTDSDPELLTEIIMIESIRVPFNSECSLVTHQYQKDFEKPEFEYTINLVLQRATVTLASGKRLRDPVEEQVPIYVPNQCIIDFLTSETGADILSFDTSVPVLEILSNDAVALNLCEEGMHHHLTERVVLWLLDENLVFLQNKNVHTKFHQCQGWGQPAVQLECNAKGFITSFKLMYSHKSSATIPTQIGFLSNLTHFDIVEGVFQDVVNKKNLIDSIPTEMGDLVDLTYIRIIGKLTGGIPKEFGALTKLKILDLFENELTGPIPEELTNCVEMKELILTKNRLTGVIPEELSKMRNLSKLMLRSNSLEGSIPLLPNSISECILAAYGSENNCFSDLENAGKCIVSGNCGESSTLDVCLDGSTGAFLTYSEESDFSGLYCTSNDEIGGRPVSYKNGNTATYMIFYCDWKDGWVLTSTYWKDALIEESGGNCGGYKFSDGGSCTGGNSWWEYNWASGNISLPNGEGIVSGNCGKCLDGSTGAFLTYSEESQYSGLYCTSNDQIGGRPVSYSTDNQHMIFYCDWKDGWVLTSTYWKDALIDENGGGCGGYESSDKGSSTGGNSWWEYNWAFGSISFP